MKKQPFVILGILQIFVALGAIPAGISMITDPSGGGLKMNAGILAGSPFKDFFIPGLFLLIVNGLLNVGGGYFSFRRSKYAGISGMILGTALILWILVQIYSIGLNFFLQPVYLLIGVLEFVISLKLTKAQLKTISQD